MNKKKASESLVLFVAIFGTGMVYLDQTALNVALPALQQSLGADISGIQWILDSYILTLSALLLLGGVLGDQYGRVRVYAVGMFLFVVTSILCGFAQSVPQIICARALQGVGGALIVPGSLALLNANVAAGKRGSVIGTWATLTSMLIAFGPTLGGWMVDNLSWRMIFFINVPLGLVAGGLSIRYVPESTNPNKKGPLDLPGALTLLIGMMGLLFGLIEGPRLGWERPIIWGSLLGGVLFLFLFVGIEHWGANPMVPLTLFRHRVFTWINLLTLVHWTAINTFFYFLPITLQQAHGYSALHAGMSILPISLSITLLSRLSGRATDRFGAYRLMIIGVLLTGIGFGWMGWQNSFQQYWTELFPVTLIYGVGLGLLIAPLTTVAMGSLPNELSGLASGINNTAARISGMLAIAIFGSLLATQFRQELMMQLGKRPLSTSFYQQLMAQSGDLGAMEIPTGLSAEVGNSVQEAIRLSLVGSFQWIMWGCVGIAILSLLILVALGPKVDESAG
ncbi:MAG: DHA2 family efflux MFS transporter permease subunit [Chloroflexota bacterium]